MEFPTPEISCRTKEWMDFTEALSGHRRKFKLRPRRKVLYAATVTCLLHDYILISSLSVIQHSTLVDDLTV